MRAWVSSPLTLTARPGQGPNNGVVEQEHNEDRGAKDAVARRNKKTGRDRADNRQDELRLHERR